MLGDGHGMYAVQLQQQAQLCAQTSLVSCITLITAQQILHCAPKVRSEEPLPGDRLERPPRSLSNPKIMLLLICYLGKESWLPARSVAVS